MNVLANESTFRLIDTVLARGVKLQEVSNTNWLGHLHGFLISLDWNLVVTTTSTIVIVVIIMIIVVIIVIIIIIVIVVIVIIIIIISVIVTTIVYYSLYCY